MFLSSANMAHIPFKSVESSMAKARRESLPKDPKTIAEINALFETESVRQNYGRAKRPIDEKASSNGKSSSDENASGENASDENASGEKAPTDEKASPDVEFFRGFYEVDGFSYCVFASADIVKEIEENTKTMERKTLYVDGTFKICPKGILNQVLIMFADLFGHVSQLCIYFI